ncbi:MAG TPA: hypothetical protein VFX98_13860 [Longimicrobiaceae bacterium]|nr:hypothetical protein [Longimicrobiaceae bacterium]
MEPLLALIQCHANVAERTLACAPVAAPGTPAGVSADLIMGGQDVYVKVSSSNASYNSGTEIFQADLTVQNLVQEAIGTNDGTTVTGVRVFFHSGPTVTGGSGNLDVANEDGTGTFTAAGQPYFLYNEILSPYEISTARTWQFSVEATVSTFSFTLYVSAAQADENGALLGPVWQGDVDADWQTAGNWSDGAVPGPSAVVSVPSDSLFTGSMPVLSADAEVGYLRVGFGSTLDLGTNDLEVNVNLDAVGTISNGTTTMSGTNALLKGNLAGLGVTGSTFLQGAAKTTGAVTVLGTLDTNGNVLTISVP